MVRSSVIPQECHERWICVDQGFSIYSSRVHRIWLMPPHGLGQYSTNTYKAWFTVPTIPEARRTAQEGSGQAQGRWSVSNASSSTLPCRHPEVGCSIYVMSTQPEGHLETFHSFLKHPLCGHKIIIESKVRSYVFSVIGIQAPKKKEGLPFPLCPLPTIHQWSCRWMPEMRRERDIWKLLCPLKWIRRESSTVSNLSQAWGPSYSGCLRLEDHKVTNGLPGLQKN